MQAPILCENRNYPSWKQPADPQVAVGSRVHHHLSRARPSIRFAYIASAERSHRVVLQGRSCAPQGSGERSHRDHAWTDIQLHLRRASPTATRFGAVVTRAPDVVPPANEEEASIDGCFSKGTFSSQKNSPGGIKVKFFLLVEF